MPKHIHRTADITQPGIRLALALLSGLFLFLLSCGPEAEPFNGDAITLGTYNIAWLGDGHNDRKDRSEADYALIAETIEHSAADVLALQEIENAAALDKLLSYLPGFDYVIASKGAQRPAVLFRKGIRVKILQELEALAIAPRLRPGLLVECRAGNFDWHMLVVHYKSTSRYDSTAALRDRSRELRLRQAAITAEWLSANLQNNGEKDIIVAGDFNDSPENDSSPTLIPLLANPAAEFISAGLGSCKNRLWRNIDHIVLSPSARQRYEVGSVGMINTYNRYKKAQAARISDHCPVVARFEVRSPDND